MSRTSCPSSLKRSCHSRDILVDENSHSSAENFNRRNLLLSQAGGIVETRHDVLACYRCILRQQIFDGVAICQHSNDLVDRDPCAFDTCLPMTDSWIDGYAIAK